MNSRKDFRGPHGPRFTKLLVCVMGKRDLHTPPLPNGKVDRKCPQNKAFEFYGFNVLKSTFSLLVVHLLCQHFPPEFSPLPVLFSP